jgi:ABC-type antimicrobial peptide transport system permease subunit
VLGAFAFSVAGLGLFGLIAYLVEQRTRDFGIQLALGARARDICRDLVRQSVVPALIGLAVGLAGAGGLANVMRASMFGWQSSGLVTVALVIGTIVGLSFLAVVGPARRVLRIDPAVTLKAE